jgi:hypothetical protein
MADGNLRARQRSASGMSRELQVERTNLGADPSLGGSRGYDVHLRRRVLDRAEQVGVAAAAELFDVSSASIYNWRQRIVPHRMTGGIERNNLTGEDQLLMVFAYIIWPEAAPDEVRAFIYNNTDGDHLYSREDIVKRANELNLRRKRASTEAYQAFTPQSLLRCQLFWSQPPPLGVATIR